MTTLSLRDIWRVRQDLQESIRQFFRERDYLSLDTPILVQAPGTEVHLQYFGSDWVDYRNDRHQLHLRSSPELHLKQALSLGIERVYHLGKCFRNGGELSPWHHPEFTMLEYYESGQELSQFMDLTEDLLRHGYQSLQQIWQDLRPLPKSVLRLSVFEAFERWAKLSLVDGDSDLAAKGMARGFTSIQPQDSFEDAYFKILIDVIEPGLRSLGAVFLYDYPASQCALARVVNDRAQRFELYWDGVELCNAFDELLNPLANRQRIQESNERRVALGLPAVAEDQDFLEALQRSIPPTCGNALGFDRWLALLLGETNLDRCIPFRRNQPYRQLLTGSGLHPLDQ